MDVKNNPSTGARTIRSSISNTMLLTDLKNEGYDLRKGITAPLTVAD